MADDMKKRSEKTITPERWAARWASAAGTGSAVFLGMTDDGAPLAGPTVEQTEQAGIVAADCCRWCVNCSRIDGVNGGVVRFACSRFGFATFATDIFKHFEKQ